MTRPATAVLRVHSSLTRAGQVSLVVRRREATTQMRWKLVAAGLLAVVAWLACWATTVVPGSPGVTMQWAVGNALAFLAGGVLGAACVRRAA